MKETTFRLLSCISDMCSCTDDMREKLRKILDTPEELNVDVLTELITLTLEELNYQAAMDDTYKPFNTLRSRRFYSLKLIKESLDKIIDEENEVI